jgi:DNA repair photolyase
MKKFKGRREDWGEFVDVKTNAPQILVKQIKRIKLPKEVFMSSVCDGWQPLEEKYKLSRTCLRILLEGGFNVSILTKNSLILRDFDLLTGYKTSSDLGMTITTLDTQIKKVLEPYASEPKERISILSKAHSRGIKTWAFLGPLIPGLTDTETNLEVLFEALKGLNLDEIYIDRLNLRWGVLESLKKGLHREGECNKIKLLLGGCTSYVKYQNYSQKLRYNVIKLSSKFGLSGKLRFCF